MNGGNLAPLRTFKVMSLTVIGRFSHPQWFPSWGLRLAHLWLVVSFLGGSKEAKSFFNEGEPHLCFCSVFFMIPWVPRQIPSYLSSARLLVEVLGFRASGLGVEGLFGSEALGSMASGYRA